VARTVDLIRRIVVEEGFRLNDRKTTVRYSGQRQRLAGIVVNVRPNLDRREYDRLKAMLTNASRHGAASQNHRSHPDFRAHLLGRVAWVQHLNPRRGRQLQAVLEQIDWNDADR
jgi:RNA-directed DNA polymerase